MLALQSFSKQHDFPRDVVLFAGLAELRAVAIQAKTE
jgi:hypothetical protein